MNLLQRLTSFTCLAFASGLVAASSLGTAFTYQGRLDDGPNAANALYDLDFALFDAPAGGSQLGQGVTFNGHPVSNGLFTVTLDFGASPFSGETRWLQIQVRTNGSRLTPFTPLSPRQVLSASPYALYAPNAGIAFSMASGAVNNLGLASNAVTSDKIADSSVTAADLSPTLASNTFWRMDGNAGTAPGAQFLGTTDNTPVEFQVNGQRVLRLEPGLDVRPNVVGGSASNAVASGVAAATIAGGFVNSIQTNGGGSTIGGGAFNTVQLNLSTIAGGARNSIQGSSSSIGGGGYNTVGGGYATVPGGGYNSAAGDFSFAAGFHAQALHEGAFVWADHSSGSGFGSTGDNAFCVRATGGGVHLSPGTSLYCGNQTRQMLNLWSTNYGIGVQGGALYFRVSDDVAGNGFAWYRGGSHNDGFLNGGAGSLTLMSLNAAGLTVSGVVNATVFNPSSDRNLKENFAVVSPRDVLDKVAALPISSWNFKGDATTPHVGPMAQDFYAAFGVGSDDKHIATVDADGVALAAIQGLNAMVKEKDAEIQALKRDVAELRKAVSLLARRADGHTP